MSNLIDLPESIKRNIRSHLCKDFGINLSNSLSFNKNSWKWESKLKKHQISVKHSLKRHGCYRNVKSHDQTIDKSKLSWIKILGKVTKFDLTT